MCTVVVVDFGQAVKGGREARGWDQGDLARLLGEIRRYRARVEQYARSARGTYADMLRRKAIAAGHTEARRILAPGDNCHTSPARPGCAEVARKGWQPIEKLTPITRCMCLQNCRCREETRRGEAA